MILPPCHSRRIIDANSREFFCAHPRHHSKDNVVNLEICNVCPLWQEPPPENFRPLPKEWPPKPRGLCVFLGEQIGLRDCPTCQGTVRLPSGSYGLLRTLCHRLLRCYAYHNQWNDRD